MTGCSSGENCETNLVYARSGAANTGELIEAVADRITDPLKA
jgi:uncharacterized metal-binding protein